MSDSDRSNSISEFCKVTGVDAVRAQHYLEANGWDHNLAISSYFEEIEEEGSESSSSMYASPGSPKPKPKSKAPHTTSRITTFASLRQSQAADSDEEEGQAFYAGGSERSGQQILGPSKRKHVNEIVQDMFKAVRTFGTEEAEHSKRSSGNKVKAFRGTGYVLGSTPNCSDPVPDEGTDNEPPEPLDISLRLWQGGFTIDDGELRDYNDPQNREFLGTVRKGEIPMELRHKASGREVHVKLEDHSHEEYIPKKPEVQAFSGAGFRLGNVAPVVTSPPFDPSPKTAADAPKAMDVDDSKPVTNLQIRLFDGSRITMRANHSHTIGDVRRYIVQVRPECATMIFSLLSSFPPKELMDDNATLEEENLINAVIVQKLKK